jgi:uncharacterized protein
MSGPPLRRKDREMSCAEIDALLGRVALAHFATVGVDGRAYVVPNLFVYADSEIYLHTTAAPGHFRRNIEHDPRICVEATESGPIFPYGRFECDTSAGFASVIAFGKARVLAADADKARFFDRFLAKYADPRWARPKGFYPRLDAVAVYAITLDCVTGKYSPTPPESEQWPARDRTKSPNALIEGNG